MNRCAVVLEVLTDLIFEEVVSGGTLFEVNPYHDPHSGKFTSKGAGALYAAGAMAAGRAAGMQAKNAGKSREDVRAAIRDAVAKHMEKYAKSQQVGRQQGKEGLATARESTLTTGKGVRDGHKYEFGHEDKVDLVSPFMDGMQLKVLYNPETGHLGWVDAGKSGEAHHGHLSTIMKAKGNDDRYGHIVVVPPAGMRRPGIDVVPPYTKDLMRERRSVNQTLGMLRRKGFGDLPEPMVPTVNITLSSGKKVKMDLGDTFRGETKRLRSTPLVERWRTDEPE
jgi:hypothetical protein